MEGSEGEGREVGGGGGRERADTTGCLSNVRAPDKESNAVTVDVNT